MGLFDWLKGRAPRARGSAEAADEGESARRAGNAALQAGRPDDALAHYDRFVAARPQDAPAHLNRGFALLRLQRPVEAASALRRAADLDPASHEAQFFLGQALLAAGDPVAAEGAFTECTRLDPAFVHGWVELGLVREQRDAVGPARQAFERAGELQADLQSAWLGVARVALRQEDGGAALAAADRALAIDDTPIAKGMRADALLRLGRVAESLAMVDAALSREPDLPPLWLVRAGALRRANRFDEALAACERHLRLMPESSDGLIEQGVALIGAGDFDAAITVFDRVLRARPGDLSALQNRALALMQSMRFDEATTTLRDALVRHPSHTGLQFALANATLSAGNFVEGWPLYESRSMARVTGAPRWQPGMAVAGKRVLLLSEQGLGDAVHFARYVPEVMALGLRVVLQVAARVKPLLEGVWPGCEIVTEPAAAGRVDLYCPLLSLPYVLGRHEPLSMSAPYVRSDASRRAYWRERIGEGREPVVGLVWSGNPAHPDDRRRSMALEQLRAQAPAAGVRFVSLQLEVRDSDKEAMQRWPRLLDVGADQRDLADTAALIEALDAVLCVDTSVGHVAGALGRPLLLMLQRCCDWRWGLEASTTPWYPSARLFRQPTAGDWTSVVRQAMSATRELPPRDPAQR
jgi:tetratricopeptide (TPR) repeat protein